MPHHFVRAILIVIAMWLVSTSALVRAEGLASLSPIAPVRSCGSLTAVHLDATVGAPVHIVSAAEITIEGSSYCAVRGEIAPHNHFEVRLPVRGWTQRFLQTGCGGLCGMLNIRTDHAETCQPVNDNGIVLASTDMGHSGGMDGSWASAPQARIDFAYRGVHLTALAAKALIDAYYGQAPRYSYFSGCSDGGREAMMEAQRYPKDFDGIAAGAPAMNFQVQNTFYHAWQARANMDAGGLAILTAPKLPALHAAALKACDAADGLVDGQIADPRACHFDPADAQCQPGEPESNACLTSAEVAAARRLYEGARDDAGHHFVIGNPQVGSELAWAGVFVPATKIDPIGSAMMAMGTILRLAFDQNPPAGFTINDFKFDQATFAKLVPLHGLNDATNPDIGAFASHGGKLILYHGWSDPHISPINTIAYYHVMRTTHGADRVKDFAKLFLFPGMYHCGGGDGPAEFDILTPLMAWVERGAVPTVIIAGHNSIAQHTGPPPGVNMARRDHPGEKGPPPTTDARGTQVKIDRTRPVYAYPQIAVYDGRGDINAAASFSAGAPIVADPTHYDWAGSGFMRPGFQREFHVVAGHLVSGSKE
jgi:hypothetical protein